MKKKQKKHKTTNIQIAYINCMFHGSDGRGKI